MTRISKQEERRHRCPKKRKSSSVLIQKTGPKKEALPLGFKQHENAVVGIEAQSVFIPKIK
ncbi:MAG: hypothetical protein WCP39_07840 [Chlamydiota bacterium]